MVELTQDVDDWLTVIATGRCVRFTAAQHRRPGVAHRPIRDAEPVAVRPAWWRDDPHPARAAAATLLTELHQRG